MAREMAQAVRSTPGVTVAAVLSRDAARSAQFCRIFANGATGLASLSDFLALVDAVYIATPPDQHGPFIRAAIAAAKPVLCEKPLTTSPEETRQILAAARDANVLVMEAIWTLALPAYRELLSTFRPRRGALLHFDFSYPVNARDGSHYLDGKTGGVLLDRGVYGYAIAIALMGEVLSQSVTLTRNEAGVDTSAELHLTHAEGARSLITLSFDRVGPNFLHASSPEGLITLGPTSLAAETLLRKPQPGPAKARLDSPRTGLKASLKSRPFFRALKSRLARRGRFLGYGASAYQPILREFLNAIERRKPESGIVPHALSERIAVLVADARSHA